MSAVWRHHFLPKPTFILFFKNFIYLFMAVLGLHCCKVGILELWRVGATLVVGLGFLAGAASVAERRLEALGLL